MEARDERPSTLQDYLALLWRRRWVILVALIVVPVVAVILSLKQSSLYEATAAVLLNPQNLAASLENLPDPTRDDPERYLKTQAELARVPEVARRTLQAAGLENADPSELLKRSSVSAENDSDLLTFSVTHGNDVLAGQLATQYARQYIRYRFELDTQALRNARASVIDRMKRLKAAGGENSDLYASLAAKSQQLDTLESLQTARAVLVREADEGIKVQPQPKRNAAFGIALGLLLGLGLAAVLEALDSHVRSPRTVAERLGLRLLARVPGPPRRLSANDELVMLADANGPEAESFRILRTNLEWANMEDGARTILVTSAVENEGKSTTVANLAVALARAGRRVALVDLDLRAPTLHRFFRLAQAPGLTDVMLRGIALEGVVAPVDIGSTRPQIDGNVMQRRGRWDVNAPSSVVDHAVTRLPEGRLEVLTAGTLASNPGEFVAQVSIVPILEYLSSRNDFVLIDGPPLLAVGDAISLSAFVDALIVVASMTGLRAATLEDLDRSLRDCPTPRLGLIVVGVPARTGYGYPTYPRSRPRAVA